MECHSPGNKRNRFLNKQTDGSFHVLCLFKASVKDPFLLHFSAWLNFVGNAKCFHLPQKIGNRYRKLAIAKVSLRKKLIGILYGLNLLYGRRSFSDPDIVMYDLIIKPNTSIHKRLFKQWTWWNPQYIYFLFLFLNLRLSFRFASANETASKDTYSSTSWERFVCIYRACCLIISVFVNALVKKYNNMWYRFKPLHRRK